MSDFLFTPAKLPTDKIAQFVKDSVGIELEVCGDAHNSAHISGRDAPDGTLPVMHLPFYDDISEDAMKGLILALVATYKYSPADYLKRLPTDATNQFSLEFYMMVENVRCERILRQEQPEMGVYIDAYRNYFDSVVGMGLIHQAQPRTTVYAIKCWLENSGTIIMDEMMMRLEKELANARTITTAEENLELTLMVNKRVCEIIQEISEADATGQSRPPIPTGMFPNAFDDLGKVVAVGPKAKIVH